MTGPAYSDVGVWLAQHCLDAVQAAIGNAELDTIAQVEVVHGTGVPLQDVCEDEAGLLWARVATVYPSDGNGQPFTTARPSFEWPAWAVQVEVGIVHCRTNIDAAGWAPDEAYETAVADRDGNYRMALLDGLAHYLPALIQPCALGMVLQPWTPLGPDGGRSGGGTVVTAIVAQLDVGAP